MKFLENLIKDKFFKHNLSIIKLIKINLKPGFILKCTSYLRMIEVFDFFNSRK
jgi:hypothetical protein